MRLQHHRTTRSFITTTRLHAYITIFHDIGPANAIGSGNLVQAGQHVGGRELDTIKRHDVTALIFQLYISRFIWRILR